MNLRAFSLVGLLVLLACGGGGGGGSASVATPSPTPTPTPTPSSPAGVFEGPWVGTMHSNSGANVTAAVLLLASGEMRYVASNGIQAVGTVSASGTSATGSGTLYAPTGYAFPGGGTSTAFTLSGSGSGGAALSGTYSSSFDSGTFAFTYNAGAAYKSSVVMANVAGAYGSITTSSGYPIAGRLTSAGVFTGSDAFGSFTGSLTVVDPTKNAFRVNVTYTPTGQPARSYAGLAFFDFRFAPVHLDVQATGPTGQFAAELQLVGP